MKPTEVIEVRYQPNPKRTKGHQLNLPTSVVRNPGITVAGRMLWCIIHGYVTTGVNPRKEMLAKDLGVTLQTLQRHLNELEGEGLLKIERHSGGGPCKPNVYTPVEPSN